MFQLGRATAQKPTPAPEGENCAFAGGQPYTEFGGSALTQDERRATTRLYLITPPALYPDRFAKELEEALAGGDVASLQLRLKDADDDTIRRAARVLRPIAQQRGIAFIMND